MNILTGVHEKSGFKCETCGKIFTLLGNLKKHVLSIHAGVKHKCDYCGKSFTQAVNLKSHVAASHERDSRLTCDICHKTYTTVKGLEFHVRKFHPEAAQFQAEIEHQPPEVVNIKTENVVIIKSEEVVEESVAFKKVISFPNGHNT